MINDQDRCEWVNVTCGTSSPGYPRHRAIKCLQYVGYMQKNAYLNIWVTIFFWWPAPLSRPVPPPLVEVPELPLITALQQNQAAATTTNQPTHTTTHHTSIGLPLCGWGGNEGRKEKGERGELWRVGPSQCLGWINTNGPLLLFFLIFHSFLMLMPLFGSKIAFIIWRR